MSLPSRERGLKYQSFINEEEQDTVAPFTGAWIEIMLGLNSLGVDKVAPFTGAWIEIFPKM